MFSTESDRLRDFVRSFPIGPIGFARLGLCEADA